MKTEDNSVKRWIIVKEEDAYSITILGKKKLKQVTPYKPTYLRI